MPYSLVDVELEHISIGLVGWYTDLVGRVLVPEAVSLGVPWLASLSLREPSPRLSPFLERQGLRPGSWGVPSQGNANGARGIFGVAGRSWVMALSPNPPKKAMCHTRLVGGTYDKYRRPPSSQAWQFRMGTSTFCINNMFFIYVMFTHYTCSTYFLFFRVFFLAPNRPRHLVQVQFNE